MQLQEWLLNVGLQYQFFGAFFISFVGALSIAFPIPYHLVILALSLGGMDPLVLTLAAGLGSTMGQFFSYALGYYGRGFISEERRRKLDFFLKLFGRYSAIAIFVFALTPLPDSLLFIPLGMLHYKLWKAFASCLAGKTLMFSIIVYFGRYFKDLVLFFFGGESSWIGIIVMLALVILALIILLKVDWERVLEKYVLKTFNPPASSAIN